MLSTPECFWLWFAWNVCFLCETAWLYWHTCTHVRTHTHTKGSVYTVDSVSGDHSCCNWGEKLGQGRCLADINNSVEMVRARGGGCGIKLAQAIHHVLCGSSLHTHMALVLCTKLHNYENYELMSSHKHALHSCNDFTITSL